MRKVITMICLTVSIMFMLTGRNEGQSISTLNYSDKYNMPDISSLARPDKKKERRYDPRRFTIF